VAGAGPIRGMQPGGGVDPHSVQSALRRVVSPLMRQIRRFEALQACLNAMPDELSGKFAPHDLRLSSDPRSSEEFGSGAAEPGERNTLFIYVATPAVGTIIERRKRELIAAINRLSPATLVEELRCEPASLQKIERQVNILRAKPD
jgi:hypothetical protein